MIDDLNKYKEITKEKKQTLTKFLLDRRFIIPGYTGKLVIHINQANIVEIEQILKW